MIKWLILAFLALAMTSCGNLNGELEYLEDYTIRYNTIDRRVELSDSFFYLLAHASPMQGLPAENYWAIVLENIDTGDSVEIWVEPSLNTFHIGNDRYKADAPLLDKIDFAEDIVVDESASDNHAVTSCNGWVPLSHFPSEAEQVVDSFYRWYICNVYQKDGNGIDNVPVVQVRDSIYGIDVESYIAKLRALPFFHETYLAAFEAELRQCSTAMAAYPNAFQYESTDIPECPFMYYFQWVGGQGEPIDGFEIVETHVSGDGATCMVNTLIENEVYSGFEIRLFLTQNGYRIVSLKQI